MTAFIAAIALAQGCRAADIVQPTPIAAAPEDRKLALRLPKDDKVVYRGSTDFDKAGMGTAAMLYPAPNVAGFFAAMITHGVLLESTKRSQKEKLQAEADKTLAPYLTALAAFTYKELVQRGLRKMAPGAGSRMIENSENPGTDWVVDSAPVFSITQDQKALMLDVIISFSAPGATGAPTYQNTFRVVSDVRDAPDLTAYWVANEAEQLKDESAGLFAESLNLALAESFKAPNKESGPQKTIRYLEGGSEKMERAQLVGGRCNRAVIRTLRGALMSVPLRTDSLPDAALIDGPPCPVSTAAAHTAIRESAAPAVQIPPADSTGDERK